MWRSSCDTSDLPRLSLRGHGVGPRPHARVILGNLLRCLAIVLLPVILPGCERASLFSRFFVGSMEGLGRTPRAPAVKLTDPVVPGAKLAVLWVGHSTVLIQMGDRFVLTDPVFTRTVGNLSARLVDPGLEPSALPQVDAVLISHLHFDHLSLGSLDLIEDKVRRIVLPEGGMVYVPSSRSELHELPSFEYLEFDGMRVTAVPVEHNGFRYGGDISWATTGFTGYVVEYAGKTVYFGGDTAYSTWKHHATGRRFPHIDLAMLPIAPIHPREFMCKTHVDPSEALQLFRDLGARRMMAIHYDTFFNSLDEMGEAPRVLRSLLEEHGLDEDRVILLQHGQQRVVE